MKDFNNFQAIRKSSDELKNLLRVCLNGCSGNGIKKQMLEKLTLRFLYGGVANSQNAADLVHSGFNIMVALCATNQQFKWDRHFTTNSVKKLCSELNSLQYGNLLEVLKLQTPIKCSYLEKSIARPQFAAYKGMEYKAFLDYIDLCIANLDFKPMYQSKGKMILNNIINFKNRALDVHKIAEAYLQRLGHLAMPNCNFPALVNEGAILVWMRGKRTAAEGQNLSLYRGRDDSIYKSHSRIYIGKDVYELTNDTKVDAMLGRDQRVYSQFPLREQFETRKETEYAAIYREQEGLNLNWPCHRKMIQHAADIGELYILDREMYGAALLQCIAEEKEDFATMPYSYGLQYNCHTFVQNCIKRLYKRINHAQLI